MIRDKNMVVCVYTSINLLFTKHLNIIYLYLEEQARFMFIYMFPITKRKIFNV